MLGSSGVEKVIEVEFDDAERKLFESRVTAHVKELNAIAEGFLNE